MGYFESLFLEHSALQAIVVLSLISAIGIMFGKVKVFGISLGVTFVFFIGILAGHLGLTVDSNMLFYAETFGLALTLSAEEAGDLLDGCELAEETQTQKTYYLSAEEFDALVLTLEEAGTEVVVSPADSPFFTVTVLQ